MLLHNFSASRRDMLIKHRILGNVSPEEVLINFTPNGGRRRMVGSPAEKWKVRMKRRGERGGEGRGWRLRSTCYCMRLSLCPYPSANISLHTPAILGDGPSSPFTAEDTEALSGEATCPSAEGGWRCTRPYANHGDRYTVVALLGPSP